MSLAADAAKNLPKEPRQALITFAERAMDIVQSQNELSIEDSEFITQFVLKFTKKFNISIPAGLVQGPAQQRAKSVVVWISTHFKSALVRDSVSIEVDDVIDEFLDRQDETFGLAHLNDEEKTKIHSKINHIREIIASSSLSDRKKNALYDRLNRLAGEVDAYGTRTERFFSFMGDIAFVIGGMADKAKPLLNEAKEMMRIVARSRGRQEGVSLPPGDDVILLPKPDDEA
jgi:hypothetical protein